MPAPINDSGSTENTNQPDDNANELLEAIQAGKLNDPGDSANEPEKELTLEELGLTEDQIKAVNQLKQKQIDKTNEHWQKTISKQTDELGRLRKVEETLIQLKQKKDELQRVESEHEFDTEKRIELGVERKEVQKQIDSAEAELRRTQVLQRIPDFEELVISGFIRDEIITVGKMSGIENPSESDINKAIEKLRTNPTQAIFIANSARKQKQISELSQRNKQIVDNTDNLSEKINQANEGKIVTGSKKAKTQLTQADIWNMNSDEIDAIIEAGRKNGAFAKK